MKPECIFCGTTENVIPAAGDYVCSGCLRDIYRKVDLANAYGSQKALISQRYEDDPILRREELKALAERYTRLVEAGG